MTESNAPLSQVAITLRSEELVLEVAIGDKAIAVQLAPQAAIELASKLLNAGVEHARRRAELRIEAEQIADQALLRASH